MIKKNAEWKEADIMDFSELTQYLDRLGAAYNLPGCDCAVLCGHELVYRHTAGFADANSTKKVSGHELYFLFSATKVITCTAVLRLIQQEKLSLEDPVAKYLPAFTQMNVLCEMPPAPILTLPYNVPTRPVKNPIKISHLLSMTAGLSYDTATEPILALQKATGGKATTRQIADAIAQSPLVCEPGTHWVYSLAHDVLAAVIEVVSGKRFSAYLQENIFNPLKMHETYFDVPVSEQSRLAALYTHDRNSPAVNPVPAENKFRLSDAHESGGAGIVTSVNDYVKFLDAMCNDGVSQNGAHILMPATIDLMRKNQLNEIELKDFLKSTAKNGYGYGLGVRTLLHAAAAKSPEGEFGWDGAAGAYVLIDPKNHIGIFYAEHVLGHMDAYFHIHPAIRDLVYKSIFG